MITKGGLEAITRSLASEYAKEQIRFNAVAPRMVDTPMHANSPKDFLKTLSPTYATLDRGPKGTDGHKRAGTRSGVLVAPRHHLLVRCSHWLNVPVLVGLIVSGISIYWTSPVYRHRPDPVTGNSDPIADAGIWICAHVPGLHQYGSPSDWVYNHTSLGRGMLAAALRFHWLCAYLFMMNGAVYVAGLVLGGGWRSLLPRRTDLRGATGMFRYYTGVPAARLRRRTWPRPRYNTKYNALQRIAYFSIAIAGLLSVLTGWAIHKPAQLSRLAAIFGGYDKARIWHFWLMWFLLVFVVPHVILVLADRWDTLSKHDHRLVETARQSFDYRTRSEQSMRLRSESLSP